MGSHRADVGAHEVCSNFQCRHEQKDSKYFQEELEGNCQSRLDLIFQFSIVSGIFSTELNQSFVPSEYFSA